MKNSTRNQSMRAWLCIARRWKWPTRLSLPRGRQGVCAQLRPPLVLTPTPCASAQRRTGRTASLRLSDLSPAFRATTPNVALRGRCSGAYFCCVADNRCAQCTLGVLAYSWRCGGGSLRSFRVYLVSNNRGGRRSIFRSIFEFV